MFRRILGYRMLRDGTQRRASLTNKSLTDKDKLRGCVLLFAFKNEAAVPQGHKRVNVTRPNALLSSTTQDEMPRKFIRKNGSALMGTE